MRKVIGYYRYSTFRDIYSLRSFSGGIPTFLPLPGISRRRYMNDAKSIYLEKGTGILLANAQRGEELFSVNLCFF